VAGRSAELVPLLAARGHAIDVCVDDARLKPGPAPDTAPVTGSYRVISAHDFVWRQARGFYDLPVYQIGNSHLHRFIWPYAFRYPGLAVVHDARVHHARAEALLSRGRGGDYRREFVWSHPGVDAAAAELATLGLEGLFYYQWPMLRAVVECSRLVGVHSRGAVNLLQADFPHRPFVPVALGEGRGDLDAATAGTAFRRAHGIPADAVLFGVFGALTEDKRVLEILEAFHLVRAWMPDARLLLAGAADPWLDLPNHVCSLGLADSVHHVTGLGDEDFDGAIAAADVTLNLRWPTALETSGPWVRALALGRSTVIIDLPHLAHVPALDPRTWRRSEPSDDLAPGAEARAVTVALPLHDLRRSLREAMRELGLNATRRQALGHAARRWWHEHHRVDRMIEDYEQAFTAARSQPAPSAAPDWPSHLRADPLAHARKILSGPSWDVPALAARLAGLST
jgi:glycosyltransferase involved in cell wall biosynthesis